MNYPDYIGQVFRPKATNQQGLRYKIVDFIESHNFGGVLGNLPAFETKLAQNPAAEIFHPAQVFLVEFEPVPAPVAPPAPKPETQPIDTE